MRPLQSGDCIEVGPDRPARWRLMRGIVLIQLGISEQVFPLMSGTEER